MRLWNEFWLKLAILVATTLFYRTSCSLVGSLDVVLSRQYLEMELHVTTIPFKTKKNLPCIRKQYIRRCKLVSIIQKVFFFFFLNANFRDVCTLFAYKINCNKCIHVKPLRKFGRICPTIYIFGRVHIRQRSAIIFLFGSWKFIRLCTLTRLIAQTTWWSIRLINTRARNYRLALRISAMATVLEYNVYTDLSCNYVDSATNYGPIEK